MTIKEIATDLATRPELRLVVKDHHDYHFKRRGKFYATITKKVCVFPEPDGTITSLKGAEAKELWQEIKTACGHTIEALV